MEAAGILSVLSPLAKVGAKGGGSTHVIKSIGYCTRLLTDIFFYFLTDYSVARMYIWFRPT